MTPSLRDCSIANAGLLTFYTLVQVFSFSYQKLRFVSMGTKQVFNSLVTRCGGKGGGVDTPIVEVGPYNLQKVRIPHDYGMLDYKLFNKMMYI